MAQLFRRGAVSRQSIYLVKSFYFFLLVDEKRRFGCKFSGV